MSRRRVLQSQSSYAVALAAFTTACAGATFQSPAEGGRQWVEISSEHFRVQTDLPLDDARDAMTELDRARLALEQIAFPATTQPPGVTQVILFDNRDEFEDLAPANAAGFFRTGSGTLDALPTIVVHSFGFNSRAVLQHELVHRYVAFHMPNAPIWLNEGLAEFFSTLRLDGDRATLGELPPGLLRQWHFDFRQHVPPVHELVSMTPRQFYASHLSPAQTRVSAIHMAHYSTAWALTHALMLSSSARRQRFERYLSLLVSAEVSASEAWRRTLQPEVPALQSTTETLVHAEEIAVSEFPIQLPPSDRKRWASRTLRPPEVHRLWAKTRPWSSGKDLQRARADIDQALALAPGECESHALLGLWWARRGKPLEAERSLTRAVQLGPDSAECRYAQAGVHLAVEEAKPASSRQLARLDAEVSAFAPLARNAEHRNFVAWFWALREEPERGLPFAREAVTEDPSCAACYDTLALLLYETGALEDAVTAQRLAANLSEGQIPAVMRRLRLFESELAQVHRDVTAAPASQPDNVVPPPADAACEKPRALAMPPPEYPQRALGSHIEGVVELRFTVHDDGSVSDVQALRGPAILAEAAIEAVKTWRFVPKRCGGQNVQSVERARLPFKLRDAR